MIEYYTPFSLLNKKDLNGNKPEIYIVTSNRTAGKTTVFNKFMIDSFKKENKVFALLYRYAYELDTVGNAFFNDIGGLFFPKDKFECVKKNKGLYAELYLNQVKCGYALALSYAYKIKKFSHIFNDVSHILFDEFMAEDNVYLSDEVSRLRSLHTSIARGHGEQVRYVPIYMVSNPITILNPYYTALRIAERLRPETRFLRGNGFVLEYNINESAKEAYQKSAFNMAFSDNGFANFESEAKYLLDNDSFIEKLTGKSRYMLTFCCDGKDYAVREYSEHGVMYVSKNVDMSCPLRIAVTTSDHKINYVMLQSNRTVLGYLRSMFQRGAFRFKDLECKNALIKALSY